MKLNFIVHHHVTNITKDLSLSHTPLMVITRTREIILHVMKEQHFIIEISTGKGMKLFIDVKLPGKANLEKYPE